jgi:hypothetical protein
MNRRHFTFSAFLATIGSWLGVPASAADPTDGDEIWRLSDEWKHLSEEKMHALRRLFQPKPLTLQNQTEYPQYMSIIASNADSQPIGRLIEIDFDRMEGVQVIAFESEVVIDLIPLPTHTTRVVGCPQCAELPDIGRDGKFDGRYHRDVEHVKEKLWAGTGIFMGTPPAELLAMLVRGEAHIHFDSPGLQFDGNQLVRRVKLGKLAVFGSEQPSAQYRSCQWLRERVHPNVEVVAVDYAAGTLLT